MIEWGPPQSTYNVSVLAEYIIRDVLLNASELLAPEIKTSLCPSRCLDYDYSEPDLYLAFAVPLHFTHVLFLPNPIYEWESRKNRDSCF